MPHDQSPTALQPVADFTVATAADADTSIGAGVRVRSYDTQFDDSSYIEGLVKSVGRILEGCPRYTIVIERRVIGGVDKMGSDRPLMAYPPMNGIPHSFGGFTNGVRRI